MWKANDDVRRRVAELTALPMFCLSLLFLVVMTVMVVFWVDVPVVFTPREDDTIDQPFRVAADVQCWISPEGAVDAGYHCLHFLYLLWPVFFLEFLIQVLLGDPGSRCWREHTAGLLACVCPPLRMCARHPDMQGKIWFPFLGWQEVNGALRDRLERLFSIPMILIALTILPVLLVDVGMKHQVQARPWLQLVLHASMGLIWFAFAAEFIVMVSVAEKKWKYCRTHWLDLAIILLPVISFLRSLRVIRATRVARLAKIQQLSKMGRLYRLRGLVMRALRALLILQLINKVLRIGPEKQLRQLQLLLEEKETEVQSLRRQIEQLQREVDDRKGRGSAERAECELS